MTVRGGPHFDAEGEALFDLGDTLFAATISRVHRSLGRPIAVGLAGSQGSGKSTTAVRLSARLRQAGLRVVVRSIDDFYLTRAGRGSLGRAIHPLLATRGVPGTHDVPLAKTTIQALLTAGAGSRIPLPVFDKASDERAERGVWPIHAGAVDIVLFEGWCIGARPQDEVALLAPVNSLEREEDPRGDWRRFVNQQLAQDYSMLFELLDLKLMLRAPSFEVIHGWRMEQEVGTMRYSARAPMSPAELGRFVAHYERVTRWMMADEPADVIADLDEMRWPRSWRIGRRSTHFP